MFYVGDKMNKFLKIIMSIFPSLLLLCFIPLFLMLSSIPEGVLPQIDVSNDHLFFIVSTGILLVFNALIICKKKEEKKLIMDYVSITFIGIWFMIFLIIFFVGWWK